jgi:hypothetical protein
MLAVAPSKPIMIGETASAEDGGSKAAWITDLLTTQLPTNYPQIKAVLWFNWNGGDPSAQWPIDSSSTSQSAFAQGIASSYYTTNQFGSIAGGPIAPPVSSAPVAPVPPIATPVPPTATPVPPTPTAVPPTATPITTSTSVTFNPVADTYIEAGSPNSTAGGSSSELRVDGYGAQTSFLRFDLSSLAGKTITSATLRLHTSTESWAGSAGTFDVSLVGSTDWSEQWMSFNNTVPISTTALGSFSNPAVPNTWYPVTLSASTVQSKAGELMSMAITERTSDLMIFSSRESGAATAPQLVLTVQ